MSITDELINNNPDKYETIIQTRILGKQLQMKLSQYNSLQREYNNLLERENNNRKRTSVNIKKRLCMDKYNDCSRWKRWCGSNEWLKKNCKQTCNTCKRERKPVKPSGYWIDLQDENYQKGMVSSPDESTDDWIFLGKSDDLNDCKLKAVQDNEMSFSSIVYYPEDIRTEWNKSCFGGVIGNKIGSSKYQQNVVTAIPPNGTTRLGGKEGEQILKKMKRLQDEIQKLSEKVNTDNETIQTTSSMLKSDTVLQQQKLKGILKQLKQDKLEVNKLIKEPDYSAEEEDSYLRQLSNYTTYGLWLSQAIIVLIILYYIYSRQSNDMSIYVYIFLGIWIYMLGNRIYGPVTSFLSALWYYISYYLVDPIVNLT